MIEIGDRVCNGNTAATVIDLIADDSLLVLYDGDAEATIELAVYFKRFDSK